MLAIVEGHLDFARFLIRKGSDFKLKDKAGSSAMHHAILEKQPDIARLLIDSGADVDLSDDEGWTPLCIASMTGQAKICRLLLQRGVNVNAATQRGVTPLIIASTGGKEDVVKVLSERQEADLHARTDGGDSALDLTVEFGYNAIAEMLQARLMHDTNAKRLEFKRRLTLWSLTRQLAFARKYYTMLPIHRESISNA
ncbi:MAG: hypothetical protein MMC23_000846 [Stictis urceolatum]|nr:hypothetical protein [Stictis urceolata]